LWERVGVRVLMGIKTNMGPLITTAEVLQIEAAFSVDGFAKMCAHNAPGTPSTFVMLC
jgi:hypothetical protein